MARAPRMPTRVDVFVQDTPSPRAHKFILDRRIQNGPDEGYSAEKRPEGAGPLVDAILGTAHVTHAYFSGNIITVTHDHGADWPTVEKCVRGHIRDYIALHDPDFHPDHTPPPGRAGAAPDDKDLADINRLLDRSVRPYITSHGGEIVLLGYDEKSHRLDIDLQGTCGDCAGSSGITLQAIEGFLRKHFDPRIEVIVASRQSWGW